MRRARKVAATSIKEKIYTEVDDVFDFFETLGMLVKRGALDEQMVWSSFSYWILNYWWAAREHISKKRQEDRTVWSYFAWLYKRMTVIEQREGRSFSSLMPSEDALSEFYEYELML